MGHGTVGTGTWDRERDRQAVDWWLVDGEEELGSYRSGPLLSGTVTLALNCSIRGGWVPERVMGGPMGRGWFHKLRGP